MRRPTSTRPPEVRTAGPRAWPYFNGGNTVFQSFFMLISVQPTACYWSSPLSSLPMADWRSYPSMISGFPAAARLQREHPQLSLRVPGWREVSAAVAAREVDFGVAELSEIDDPELQTAAPGAHRDHFDCRSGHPILRHGTATPHDLLQFPGAMTRLPPRVAARLRSRSASLSRQASIMASRMPLDWRNSPSTPSSGTSS